MIRLTSIPHSPHTPTVGFVSGLVGTPHGSSPGSGSFGIKGTLILSAFFSGVSARPCASIASGDITPSGALSQR